MSRILCLSLVIILAVGCRAMSPWPNKTLARQFEEVDRLSIGSPESGLQVTSKESIQHLRDIYLRANWKPYMDTVPSDIVAIHAYAGSQESFSLDYGAGWLIENNKNGHVRKGILNDEDKEWVRNLVKPVRDQKLGTSTHTGHVR